MARERTVRRKGAVELAYTAHAAIKRRKGMGPQTSQVISEHALDYGKFICCYRGKLYDVIVIAHSPVTV